MAWPNLQPQAPSPRQRTSARPPSISPPIASQRALCRIGRTARRHNEAASSHPTRRFPASVAPSPTSAADPNPHSRRLCPAGSFLGDFRTPAGARNSSQERPVRFPPRLGRWHRPNRSRLGNDSGGRSGADGRPTVSGNYRAKVDTDSRTGRRGRGFASALVGPTPNLLSLAIGPLGSGVPGEIAIGARRVAEHGGEACEFVRCRDRAVPLIATEHQAQVQSVPGR